MGVLAAVVFDLFVLRVAIFKNFLVRNLTISAKLERTDDVFEASKFDLNELVQRIVLRHRSFALCSEISLDYAVGHQPTAIEADVTLLEQAVGNLVYNAIAHNRKGGHVAVILETRPEGVHKLKVIDDGPGIAPKELERVLRRGARGKEARTRVPEGRGLGLPITQRIIELHRYSMKFRASEYGGLEVEIVMRSR